MKLVNSENNPVLLQSAPHIHVLDLAVVFYIYKEKDGISKTSLIRTEHMTDWNVTEQDLFDEFTGSIKRDINEKAERIGTPNKDLTKNMVPLASKNNLFTDPAPLGGNAE